SAPIELREIGLTAAAPARQPDFSAKSRSAPPTVLLFPFQIKPCYIQISLSHLPGSHIRAITNRTALPFALLIEGLVAAVTIQMSLQRCPGVQTSPGIWENDSGFAGLVVLLLISRTATPSGHTPPEQ